MSDSGDWTRVLQLVNLVGIAHLAGYHFGSHRIAMPNILQLRDQKDVAEHWFRGWDVGRKYGPTMVTGTAAVFGFLAWKDGTESAAFVYNLAASLLVGSVAPYTKFRVFPVNDVLLAEHERLTKGEKKTDDTSKPATLEQMHKWAADWQRLDLHRQLLAVAAAVSGLIAAAKS